MSVSRSFKDAHGQVAERLKAHAWKACIRSKRIGGSNPPLSAKSTYILRLSRLIELLLPKSLPRFASSYEQILLKGRLRAVFCCLKFRTRGGGKTVKIIYMNITASAAVTTFKTLGSLCNMTSVVKLTCSSFGCCIESGKANRFSIFSYFFLRMDCC